MKLFLDVISPIPKFVITDNNKLIESLDILDNHYIKISDIIHDKFLILQKKYNVLDLLDLLIVCTGPGSYTSLRIGVSFMLGISYSKRIPIFGISYTELLRNFVSKDDFYSTLIIICSTNNQNFVCLPIHYKNYQYKILKINEKQIFDNIDLTVYSRCISNFNLPDFFNKKVCSTVEKLEYLDFKDMLDENFLTMSNSKTILQPIYISDNRLFD